MLDNITLDDLINYLGNPTRKIGAEYIWQCPYCMDSHKDNLKYNEHKRVLKCFANDTHAGEVLRGLNKSRGINTPRRDLNPIKSMPATPKLTDEQIEEKLLYMLDCERELAENKKALAHLQLKRGINAQIATRYGLGIDKELKKWVIPIWQYQTTLDPVIIGFEYRPALLPNAIKEKRTEAEKEAKKGISRKKGSISHLAMINIKPQKADSLIIVEGYFDGLALWQHLEEQKQAEKYHIVTPSNGISILSKQIASIDLTAYKNFYLYVDSDEAAQPIAQSIIEQYPFMELVKLDCKCKDFNEHYLRCIKKVV